MILSYDGTHFLGWQESTDGMTIQEALRRLLEQIYQHPIRLQAASRTDKGVHAEGQVAHYLTEKFLDLTRLKVSLNQLLPRSIRVLKMEEAKQTFHPTLDATGKAYHYSLCLTPVQSPFLRSFSWHIPYSLDVSLMKKGAVSFVGTHDFTSLANQRDPKPTHTLCTLSRIEIIQEEERLRFEIEGNRFLYKMVRNLVGTLVDLGRGKLSLEEVQTLLEKKDRTKGGIVAPAHGLVLKKVYYPLDFATLD